MKAQKITIINGKTYLEIKKSCIIMINERVRNV